MEHGDEYSAASIQSPTSLQGAPAAYRIATDRIALTWVGNPWSLARLCIVNFGLTLLTLGIYMFWGKIELRKRIWLSLHIDGEPLEYTGTGRELFVGFLIVTALAMLPIPLFLAMAVYFPILDVWVEFIFQMVLSAGTFFLASTGYYRARGYRLTRTSWRGIHGSLGGSAWTYGWSSAWTALAAPAAGALAVVIAHFVMGPRLPVALLQNRGLASLLAFALFAVWVTIIPWRSVLLHRRLMNDMRFGNKSFRFDGSPRPLYARFVGRWAGVMLLAVVTASVIFAAVGAKISAWMTDADSFGLGISLGDVLTVAAIIVVALFLYSILTAWYRAAEMKLLAAATRFGDASFKVDVNAQQLIVLFITNYFISLLSLGILRPVAEARELRFFVERLSIEGNLHVASIRPGAVAVDQMGEGLAQVFSGHGL